MAAHEDFQLICGVSMGSPAITALWDSSKISWEISGSKEKS